MLPPPSLWARVREQTTRARRGGVLQSLPAESVWVEQGGVRFLVRVVVDLGRKKQATKKQGEDAGEEADPFLPYEQELFVADLSDTHLCLLNKFNVLEHHLLIVTRRFESQETWLTRQDFAAVWTCMAQVGGLVFYNAGKRAGASQGHKHLQLVPFPLVPGGPDLPAGSVLAGARFQGRAGIAPGFPFVHALLRLDLDKFRSPAAAVETLFEGYLALLGAIGLKEKTGMPEGRLSEAYNLLLTGEWMLLVPRSQEGWASISVNALGFAGALLVTSQQQLKELKVLGPMELLKRVAVSV